MYTPLGTGDVDIAGIVSVLRDNGFDGWFVLEQDTILDGEPDRRGPRPRRGGQRGVHARTCERRVARNDAADRSARRVPDRRARHRRSRAAAGPPTGGGGGAGSAARRGVRREVRRRARVASYSGCGDDPEVDVVYNPLANSLHAPWNLAAVAAGKPVLTEKPFARDQAEARQVARRRRRRGCDGDGGFSLLFHPVTQRALALAGDGALGELTTSRCGWLCPHREPTIRGGHWSSPAAH